MSNENVVLVDGKFMFFISENIYLVSIIVLIYFLIL